MNIKRYKEFLLSSIPRSKLVSGGKEILCRCMYCPDSSDIRNAHFYISIPQNEYEPSLFHCFKCHAAGVVTYKKLIEWNIYDDEIAIDLVNHNNRASKYRAFGKYFNNAHYNIINRFTNVNDNSLRKLNYLNNRLGTHYTYQDLYNLKICLNLHDLLNENHIQQLTRNPNIVQELNDQFLGFISIDNAFLNMRRTCDEGIVYKGIDKRYINYKIFDKFDTSERFYTIPTRVNLNNPYRTKIHIAEGPFDILSIYENLRHREEAIYTSIAGSNYKGLAMYFLERYKLPFVEIHLYPDNDNVASTSKINEIKEYLGTMCIPTIIHRNGYPGEKDFGVSIDRIDEKIIY